MGTAQVTFVEDQVRSSDVTRNDITGNDVTGTANEREIISRVFYPYFPRFFPELLDTNNVILNPTNRSPSDI
jgi:hypothetical protein